MVDSGKYEPERIQKVAERRLTMGIVFKCFEWFAKLGVAAAIVATVVLIYVAVTAWLRSF